MPIQNDTDLAVAVESQQADVQERNRCRYWGNLIVLELPPMLVIGNAEFPSCRRNDQVNVIDGTKHPVTRVFAGWTTVAPSAEGGGNQGGFHDSAFTP